MRTGATQPYGRNMPADTTPTCTSLVQRLGDAELPTTGRWTLHRASYVGISAGRDRIQPQVSDGSFTITHPPAHSNLAINAVRGDRRIRLIASTVGLHAAADGFSCWHLVGTVDDGITHHDVELAMMYHGVRRRGSEAWAWYTGRAVTPTATRRLRPRRAELTVVLDLLFNAPTRVPAEITPYQAAA